MKMKNALVVFAICACSAVGFTGCGANETVYNVIGTNKTYELTTGSVSGAEVDEEITIDGKFDEKFYEELNWMTAYKNFSGNEAFDGHGLGTRKATIRSTVYIAKKGVLLAMDVDEGHTVSWVRSRGTAFNSGVEFNFALYPYKDALRNLCEIDLTVHKDFQFRMANDKFGYGAYEFYDKLEYSNHPNYNVALKGGSVSSGTCTGYSLEMFLPYTIFGENISRPAEVYFNPGIITPWTAVDNGRDRYSVGEAQTGIGYLQVGNLIFDRGGFVCNKISVSDSGGGTVSDQFGRDWYVAGQNEITLLVKPDNGKRLTSLKVDGQEKITEITEDRLTVATSGKDMEIVATFG